MQVNSISSMADYASTFQQAAEKNFAPQSNQEVQTPPVTETERTENLAGLQAVLAESNISLNFSRDEKSGEIVVKLVDSATGEAIRQLPTEVSLKLSAAYKLQGQFVDKQG